MEFKQVGKPDISKRNTMDQPRALVVLNLKLAEWFVKQGLGEKRKFLGKKMRWLIDNDGQQVTVYAHLLEVDEWYQSSLSREEFNRLTVCFDVI